MSISFKISNISFPPPNLTKFLLPVTLLNTLFPELFKVEGYTKRTLKLMSRHLQPHNISVN